MSCAESCSTILISKVNWQRALPSTSRGEGAGPLARSNLAAVAQLGWALSSPAGNGCDDPAIPHRSPSPMSRGRGLPAGARRGGGGERPPRAPRPGRGTAKYAVELMSAKGHRGNPNGGKPPRTGYED